MGGDLITNPVHGGGMDVFWNYTLFGVGGEERVRSMHHIEYWRDRTRGV